MSWGDLDGTDSAQDSLSGWGGGRRPARYPALPPEEAETALGALRRQGLSTLGYVGSLLDKFGGRAVRGSLDELMGHGGSREILSLIPFSDTLGLTNPEDIETHRGGQLLKHGLGYDPEQAHGHWGAWAERNLLPMAVESGLDPATWLGGVGALTKAGKAAEKLGTKVPRFWQSGFVEAVRRGERTAVHGLRGPTVASGLEAVGTGLGRANDLLRRIPGVAAGEDILGQVAGRAQTVGRGLFSAAHGFSTDPLIQASRAAIKYPGEEAADVVARKTYAELGGRQRALEQAGLDPDQLQRYLRQKAEIQAGPATEHFFDPQFVGSMSPAQRAEADAIAAEMRRRGGQIPLDIERQAGYAGSELADPTIHYSYRQQNLTPPQGIGPQRDWLGRAKALPVDLGKERLEALTQRPGGTMQIEDILHTPGMAGPTAMPLPAQIKEIIRSDLGLPLTAEFSPLHPAFGGPVLPPIRPRELGVSAEDFLAQHLPAPVGAALSRAEILSRALGPALPGAPGVGAGAFLTQQLPAPRRRAALSRAEILRRAIGQVPQVPRDVPAPHVFSKYTAPAAQTAEELANLARATPQERLFTPTGQQIPYFKPDVAQATALRQQRAGRAATTADTIINVIGKAKVPQGPGTVPVPNVMKSLKLDTEVGYRRALEAIGEDPQAILAAAFPQAPGTRALSNQEILGKALESYHLPAGTAKGMTELLQRFTTPHEWGPIGQWLKGFTGATKRGLYSIWGPSHARNYESAVAENLKDFGLKPFSQPYRMTEQTLLGQAVDTKIPLFAHLPKEAQREALLDLAYAHRIIGSEAGELGGRVAPFTGSPRAPRQSAVDILKETMQGLKKGEWRAPWAAEVVDPATGQVTKGPATLVKMGQALNQLVEERVRLAPFAYLLQQGYTPEMAAAKVFATHYDYERGVSEFMKNVGSQALLFPTFTSQNIPKQFLQAIESPGKQMAAIRLSGAMRSPEEGTYTPDYLQQGGLAIPLPSEGLPEGTQRFLTQMGLPMEEAFGHLRLGPTPLTTLQRTAQGFLSMVNPALKAPVEWATGTQLHTGRALTDLYPGAIQSLGGLLPQDVSVALAELTGATPLSRLASTANRLLDLRKLSLTGELGNLAATTSGLRVSDVDVAKWRAIDERKRLEEQLRQSQNIRAGSYFYVPKSQQEFLSPREEQLMKLFHTVEKNARLRRSQQQNAQYGNP